MKDDNQNKTPLLLELVMRRIHKRNKAKMNKCRGLSRKLICLSIR